MATDKAPGMEHADLVEQLKVVVGARLQKLRLTDDARLLLQFFVGERREVLVDPRPPAPLVALQQATASAAELGRGGKPPQEQAVLRKELVPARLDQATLDEDRGLLSLTFERKDGGGRTIHVELTRDDPRAVLTGGFESGERVLCVLGDKRAKDGRDLRRGQSYTSPRTPGPLPAVDMGGGLATEHAADQAARSEHRELRAQLKSAHKRVIRRVRALEGDLRKHGDPDALGHDGEVLKTVMSRVERGADEVIATDFDGSPRRIALNPALSARANLEAIFRRARRARTGLGHITPRLDAARELVVELAATRTRMTGAPSDDVVQAAGALLGDQRTRASPRRAAARVGGRKAWRSFRLHGDAVARVGRSARDNDALNKSARGNDLWLHARGTVGAHVVVSLPAPEPATELLLDAAQLARWFSPLRDDGAVDVQYTRAKHLDKPRGAAAGLVLVRKEKVVRVKRDDARITRLLAAEVPA